MRSTPPDDPQPGKELPLSGAALLELMRAALARVRAFPLPCSGFEHGALHPRRDVITVSPLVGPAARGRAKSWLSSGPESGKLVVHRVVDVRGGSGGRGGVAVIRGDALHGHPDEIVPFENILGNVTRIERDGRLRAAGSRPRAAGGRLAFSGPTAPPAADMGELLARPGSGDLGR